MSKIGSTEQAKITILRSKLAPKGPILPENAFSERSELLGGKMSFFKSKTCTSTKKMGKKWAKNGSKWVKLGAKWPKTAKNGQNKG